MALEDGSGTANNRGRPKCPSTRDWINTGASAPRDTNYEAMERGHANYRDSRVHGGAGPDKDESLMLCPVSSHQRRHAQISQVSGDQAGERQPRVQGRERRTIAK